MQTAPRAGWALEASVRIHSAAPATVRTSAGVTNRMRRARKGYCCATDANTAAANGPTSTSAPTRLRRQRTISPTTASAV